MRKEFTEVGLCGIGRARLQLGARTFSYRWPIGWASFGRPQIRVREEHENNIAALTF
jgi:hypothetical protein